MSFPADIKGCMKDCILSLFWPRKDIVGFFEKHGCTKAEIAPLQLEGENALKRPEIIDALFTALAARSDQGLGPFRAMLQSLLNWSHFDSYYFDKLRKLDRDTANKNLEHLRQLQEIRDAKIKADRERRAAHEAARQQPTASLDQLRTEYLDLLANKTSRQQRGYRKEIERLLRDNVLKVTISSPTLAQGLNLSATAVVMHSLHRNGERIEISEFKNVIGRAGRAYVDVEGIVLFPMFDEIAKKRRNWEALITDLGAREMESGLVRLVAALLTRMHARIGGDLNQLVEYVVNNAAAWTFPEVANETPEDRERALADWERHIATLDTALLSLIGDNDIPDEGVAAALDDVLQSSLWHRRLLRQDNQTQHALKAGLLSRGRLIWSQSTAARRRGYFLAGVGLTTGHALDAIAEDANWLLIRANGGILQGDTEAAIAAVTALAERVFTFYPFTPDPMPANWQAILRAWLLGEPLAGIAAGQESDTLQFIEGGLVYRLPWAMEAIRVRAIANGDTVGELPLDEYELRLAVAAVETGTLNRSATILIQAGFNSRLGAIKAVTDTGAIFQTAQELRHWLNSEALAGWRERADWPTPETREMWMEFARSFVPQANSVWADRRYWAGVQWLGIPPPPGTPVQLHHWNGQLSVLAADGTPIGALLHALNPNRAGLLIAQVAQDISRLDLSYLGPDDLVGI